MLGMEVILHGTHLAWNLYLFLYAEKYNMIKQHPSIACSFLRANFRLHPTIMTSHYDNKTFVLRIIFFREHKLLSLRRKLWCDLSVSCLSLGSFGLSNMGNCLKSSGQDDISLLHGDESPDSPRAGEPPPPYQVQQKKL